MLAPPARHNPPHASRLPTRADETCSELVRVAPLHPLGWLFALKYLKEQIFEDTEPVVGNKEDAARASIVLGVLRMWVGSGCRDPIITDTVKREDLQFGQQLFRAAHLEHYNAAVTAARTDVLKKASRKATDVLRYTKNEALGLLESTWGWNPPVGLKAHPFHLRTNNHKDGLTVFVCWKDGEELVRVHVPHDGVFKADVDAIVEKMSKVVNSKRLLEKAEEAVAKLVAERTELQGIESKKIALAA